MKKSPNKMALQHHFYTMIALYIYTILAFIFICSIFNFIIGFIIHLSNHQPLIIFHSYSVLIYISFAIIFFICSLYKYIHYQQSGIQIANYLGAQNFDDLHHSIHIKKIDLINKNIAKYHHISPAHLFILKQEVGINALTVGYHLNDTSIILTQGLIQSMDYDEIKVILEHEYQKIIQRIYIIHSYSDIILFGFLFSSQIGYYFVLKSISNKQQDHFKVIYMLYFIIGIIILFLSSVNIFIVHLIKFLLFYRKNKQLDLDTCNDVHPKQLIYTLCRIKNHPYGSKLYRADYKSLTQYCFASTLSKHNIFKSQSSTQSRILAIAHQYQLKDIIKTFAQEKNIPFSQYIKHLVWDILPFTPNIPTYKLNTEQINTSWYYQLPCPSLRKITPDLLPQQKLTPIKIDIRQFIYKDHQTPMILKHMIDTPTGCREIIWAIFLIRQFGKFISNDIDVSRTTIDALLTLDQRYYIPIFLLALEKIQPLPLTASHSYLERLLRIIQHDQHIGLLDCLLFERIRASQNLLPIVIPFTKIQCQMAIIHLTDSILITQYNDIEKIQQIRQMILTRIFHPITISLTPFNPDQSFNLLFALQQIAGLTSQDKRLILDTLKQIWSNYHRNMTQNDVDTIQLLYWRLNLNDEYSPLALP